MFRNFIFLPHWSICFGHVFNVFSLYLQCWEKKKGVYKLINNSLFADWLHELNSVLRKLLSFLKSSLSHSLFLTRPHSLSLLLTLSKSRRVTNQRPRSLNLVKNLHLECIWSVTVWKLCTCLHYEPLNSLRMPSGHVAIIRRPACVSWRGSRW